MYFGDLPILSPRHWAPVWPKNGDLIPDLAYQSIHPCRPDGVSLQCCYFDVKEDPRELVPLLVDCDALKGIAAELYEIEGGCPDNGPMCLEPNSIPRGTPPSNLRLWTHTGAAGPFLSSDAKPFAQDLAMKCLCHAIEPGVTPANVKSFTSTIFSPAECFADVDARLNSVECEGGFTFAPEGGKAVAYGAQGMDPTTFAQLVIAEQNRLLALNLPSLVLTALSYITREGYTEWPIMSKFPTNAFRLDTCANKGKCD